MKIARIKSSGGLILRGEIIEVDNNVISIKDNNIIVNEFIEMDVKAQSKNLVRNGDYEYGEIEPWILYNEAQLSWDEEVGAYLFQGNANTNDLAYQELTLEPHTAYTLSLIRQRQYGNTSIRILRSLEGEDYIANIELVGTSLAHTSTTFITEGQTQYYISFASTALNRRGYAKEIQLEKGDTSSEYASYGEVWIGFKDGKVYTKGELIEGVEFFTPKNISGCQLWLDATTIQVNNGDNILLWEDLSGNNNHATQTNQSQQPIFIDNAVVFDGVDDSLEFGANKFNMGLDDMTFFSVITTTKTADQSIFSKARASSQNYRYALRMVRGGVMDGFMQGNGGGDVTPFGVTNLANGNPHVLVHEFNRSGNLSLYADGIYEGGASISRWENADMVSINPSRLGAYTASNNISPISVFGGKIMEILIYDRTLTESERIEVEQYLIEKWGI